MASAGSRALAPTEGQLLPRLQRLQRDFLRWFSHSSVGLSMTYTGILTMRGIPLLSLLVVTRRAWRLTRVLRRIQKSLPVMLAKLAVESWAFLELGFWLYFRWKKQSLEARRAYQPSVLRKNPGERRETLRRLLANIDQIQAGHLEGLAAGDFSPKGATLKATLVKTGLRRVPSQVAQSLESWVLNRDTSAVSFSAHALMRAPSVENFLRCWDATTDGQDPMAPQLKLAASITPERRESNGHQSQMVSKPSVQNLLRSWSDSGSAALDQGASAGGQAMQSKELMSLKHLELCSWYRYSKGNGICSDVREICRGNIEEWILSYWFDGAESRQALTDAEADELDQLVAEVAGWADLPQPHEHHSGRKVHSRHDWAGRNPALHCFRLRNDPFPAVHRPLLAYAMTAFAAPFVGSRALAGLGFQPYRAGSTEYWFRPPGFGCSQSGGRPRVVPGWRQPLVFCHGVGVGPTMCLPFLQPLARGLGEDHPIFLVDTAAVSMRFSDDVPCAREVAANMVDMLLVWGFREAHFVGHSFGSFLIAWMLRYQPSYVSKCTFIDPVCFLLLKVLVEGHELQQVRRDTHMDTMEIGIKYFVLTELFVCNFVCRCFFWEESQLDLEALERHSSLLVMESDDAIAPTHSIRRLVRAERQRRAQRGRQAPDIALDVLWLEGLPHAGFLVDAEANASVAHRLCSFHTGREEDQGLV